MALVKCPDCGRDVSESAPTCPGCGRPIGAPPVVQTAPQGMGAGAAIGGIVAGLGLMVIILIVLAALRVF